MTLPDSPVRLIRKYPNRRLYDTGRSAYIALEDIRALILARETFRVVDARNGDDLTHAVLLQVFLDGEGQGLGLLSPGALRALIVAQNGPQARSLAVKLNCVLNDAADTAGAPNQAELGGDLADRMAQNACAAQAAQT